MQRTLLVLAVSFSLFIGSTPVSILADEGKDNQELQKAAKETDVEAESDSGRAAVVKRLENEFKVKESQINDLRSKKLGYGEIGIALSLAQQMPGGITNENIQKVMDLRQGEGKTGWGNVAKQLNLNLGKVVSQEQKISHELQAGGNLDTKQSSARGSEPKFQRHESSGKPGGYTHQPHGYGH